MKQALGLLEVKGLAGAILIADVMTKAATIELIGIERAKGFGWMTIKVIGDVGAVNAAVAAGSAQANNDAIFISAKVIPRPGNDIDKFFLTKDNYEIKQTSKKVVKETLPKKELEIVEKVEEPVKSITEPPAIENIAVEKKETPKLEEKQLPEKPTPTNKISNSTNNVGKNRKPSAKGVKK